VPSDTRVPITGVIRCHARVPGVYQGKMEGQSEACLPKSARRRPPHADRCFTRSPLRSAVWPSSVAKLRFVHMATRPPLRPVWPPTASDRPPLSSAVPQIGS